MRFVTYGEHGRERVGVVGEVGVHPLPAGRTLLSLLSDGTLREEGSRALAGLDCVGPPESLDLRAPLPVPPTVRDFMTFERHVEGVAKLAGGDAEVVDQW